MRFDAPEQLTIIEPSDISFSADSIEEEADEAKINVFRMRVFREIDAGENDRIVFEAHNGRQIGIWNMGESPDKLDHYTPDFPAELEWFNVNYPCTRSMCAKDRHDVVIQGTSARDVALYFARMVYKFDDTVEAVEDENGVRLQIKEAANKFKVTVWDQSLGEAEHFVPFEERHDQESKFSVGSALSDMFLSQMTQGMEKN